MTRRTALILLAVVAGAVAVNALVAAVARQAGASTGFAPLHLPVYGGFTAVGVLAGFVGWQIVRRRSPRPGAVLKFLVPAVALLSFVPDVALLALKFIPESNSAAVAALMVMHVVVVAFAVPGYLLAAPMHPLPAGPSAPGSPAGHRVTGRATS